jgi:hypothetical protein
MKHEDALKQPFFAKMLELQKPQEGFLPTPTSPIKDNAHTLKYPSDGDDDIYDF